MRATKPACLYDADFAAWTSETASLLRQRRFTAVDADNVAEEIEDLGNRLKREVRSRLRSLLVHLLKLRCAASERSRSWRLTVFVHRQELGSVFEMAPSLRTRLGVVARDLYASAVRLASIQTGLHEKVFPPKCPWSPRQLLDQDYWPQ